MSLSPRALRIIEEGHRFGAFYRGELANHLPMAIAALDAMGADEATLSRFAARYGRTLEPIPPGIPAIGEAPGAWLGHREAFPAWVTYFEEQLATDANCVSAWIGRLMPGVASGAFHGLIRVAYAAPSGSRRELAHALACWASAWEALPGSPRPADGRETPAGILSSLARHEAYGGRRREGGLIAARTQAAANEAGFDAIAARVSPEELTLEALARLMLACYSASGNFTILHGVTACHALRTLMPMAGDGRAALLHFWRALCAAFIGAGSPPVAGEAFAPETKLGWDAIRARAVQCEDEHDVKLAYSCWCEWQSRGDDLYRRVAASRVSRAVAFPGVA